MSWDRKQSDLCPLKSAPNFRNTLLYLIYIAFFSKIVYTKKVQRFYSETHPSSHVPV